MARRGMDGLDRVGLRKAGVFMVLYPVAQRCGFFASQLRLLCEPVGCHLPPEPHTVHRAAMIINRSLTAFGSVFVTEKK